MALNPLIAVLLLMLFIKEGTLTGERKIELGASLSPGGNGSSWASSSGHFAFGFYKQGDEYAVGIWVVGALNQSTIVWTHRDSLPFSRNSTLTLNTTGLKIFQSRREAQDLISTSPEVTSSASMLDSGNFVLYDNNHTVVWQSFDHPTDTILGVCPNQTIRVDFMLSSKMMKSSLLTLSTTQQLQLLLTGTTDRLSDDVDYLGLDASGVSLPLCCFYEPSSDIIRSAHINFQHNYVGHDIRRGCPRCLYRSPGKKSDNTSSIFRATLDVDGNFKLYEHQFEGNDSSHAQVLLLWSTSVEKCHVNGVCGFNSYCSNVTVTGDAVCHCFPGFVRFKSTSSGNASLPLECVLAHSQDGCQITEDQNKTNSYNISPLENVYWGDGGNSPYFVKQMKKEECEKSFLEDCDCMAVLYSYSDSNCKKYGLPLTYGRRNQSASTVALFKRPSRNWSSLPNNYKPMPKMIRKVYRYTTLYKSENLGFTEECSLRSFSFDELEKSTRGFTEEIGRGSFGAVYRGTIGDNNKSIAVKRLERIADEGEREFRTEITTIARTHHRNLVKLIGFCIDGSRKLLVYEYVGNGSLSSLLFESEKKLSWGERLKMALDVARGLLYLHEECEVRIVHFSINPRNILMDEAWTAKISDFGLARLHSRVKKEDDGTSKYLAPEWQKDAPISVKVDIYSYGMVLLEILCRRSSIEMNVSSAEEILLSSWAYQCFAAGQLDKLVTEDEGVDWMLLERMVKVGLWCVQDNPHLRPSIKNVILMLQGLKDIPIPPSPAHLHK
ncbi:hypothetical protein Fmac_012809 [Flemingia macrophylla]|uniref:Receptor-like serine/threonine-protein kinase n=1 Tax=Flemingia macrophylla TaxID=520843 RepID=A0ABD1MRE7_9FABA